MYFKILKIIQVTLWPRNPLRSSLQKLKASVHKVTGAVHLMQQFYSKNLETMYTPINREIPKMKYILYYEILCIYFKNRLGLYVLTWKHTHDFVKWNLKKAFCQVLCNSISHTDTCTHTLNPICLYERINAKLWKMNTRAEKRKREGGRGKLLISFTYTCMH